MTKPSCPGCGLQAPGEHSAWHSECLDRDECERSERAFALEVRRLKVASGIPAGLLNLAGTAILSSGLDDVADGWAHGRERHVVLTGAFGVGKTTVAAVAALRRLELGRSLWWSTAPLLFARLGSGLGSPERAEALSVLTGKRALVLDDLDKVRPTEYGAEQVFVAIDRRLTEGVPLLITSNLTPAEMVDRYPSPYGSAIASRLGGECRVVQMQGMDRRFSREQTAELTEKEK